MLEIYKHIYARAAAEFRRASINRSAPPIVKAPTVLLSLAGLSARSPRGGMP
jgi:hypothetical protein